MDLSGKTVFVTGGSSGIGRAVVELAHASGARVWYTYLSGEERARSIERSCPGVRAVRCDLRSADDVADAIRLCARESGGLHGLVNSAGIYLESRLDDENFVRTLDDILSINLHASVHTMRAAVPLMRAGASIVNLSSIESAQTGKAGSIPYAVSK